MDAAYYIHHFLVGFLSLVVVTEKICYAVETYIKDNYP